MTATRRSAQHSESGVYALVLGQMIMMLRDKRAVTQTELGTRAGLGQVTLSRIERGQSQIEPLALRRVAEALGLSPAALDDLLQDAYQRTRRAVVETMNIPEEQPWWERALAVVGYPGLAGLSRFAVAGALMDAFPEPPPSP